MSASDYMKNAYLNWFRGVAFPSAPTGLYVGLHSSPTTEVTTQFRPAGRLQLTPGAITTAGVMNTNNLDFGAAANAVNLTHVGIYDAQSGGNLLELITLSATVVVPAGKTMSSAIGSYTIKFN